MTAKTKPSGLYWQPEHDEFTDIKKALAAFVKRYGKRPDSIHVRPRPAAIDGIPIVEDPTVTPGHLFLVHQDQAQQGEAQISMLSKGDQCLNPK